MGKDAPGAYSHRIVYNRRAPLPRGGDGNMNHLVRITGRVYSRDAGGRKTYYWRRICRLFENGTWKSRDVRKAIGPNLQRALCEATEFDAQYEATLRGETPRKDATVTQFVELYVAHIRDERRLLGWRTMRSNVTAFARHLGNQIMRRVTKIDVEGFLARRKQIVRPATVNSNRRDVRRMFVVAVEMGYADGNPAAGTKPVTGGKRAVRLPTSDEVSRILGYTKGRDHWLFPLVVLLIGTGARLSEVLRLTWDRVSFISGTVVLVRRKVSDEHVLPLEGIMAQELNGMWLKAGMPTGGPVIARKDGRPLTACGAYCVAKKVFTKLGLPWMNLGVFRRLAATVVAEATGGIRASQALLGHSSSQVTERYLGRGEQARAQGIKATTGYLEGVYGTFPGTLQEQPVPVGDETNKKG
jgi:integrase